MKKNEKLIRIKSHREFEDDTLKRDDYTIEIVRPDELFLSQYLHCLTKEDLLKIRNEIDKHLVK